MVDNSAGSAASMWPTLMLVVLFVAAMAVLPWVVRRLQQKNMLSLGGLRGARAGNGVTSRVLSTVALGPQQRVVTVQVGEGDQSVRLVLGVTAQNMQCLHVLQSPPAQTEEPKLPVFADAMAQAQERVRAVAQGPANV